MGLRFDLRTASWLAHMLQPGTPVPQLDNPTEERETLGLFLGQLRDGFYSSQRFEIAFRQRAERASVLLEMLESGIESERQSVLLRDVLLEFKTYFTKRNWTALLIPSGQDEPIDEVICSAEFLRDLVNIHVEDPGLILQLKGMQQAAFPLTDVFPAFRTALSKSTEWPGVLLWTDGGDSTFLPFPRDVGEMRRCANWIFSHLANVAGVDLEFLARQYVHEFTIARAKSVPKLNIIQISDLHLGSKEADRRINRVAQLIRGLVRELGNEKVAIVVTGDLMDTPSERNFNNVRGFLEFLMNQGTEEPILILGNHDVRNEGYLSESLRLAMRIPATGGRVIWHDDCRVGFACFSSIHSGHLARGFVGEQQMIDVGNEIDKKHRHNSYAVLALLHHHPVPVTKPDWYEKPFYSRMLGSWFETTVALKDADRFLKFADARNIAAVLHGHKHIPRIAQTGVRKLPIIGCGSTVGKVATVDGGTYMSINVITCDTANKKLSARLMAERIPGAGMNEEKRHELVMITGLP